MILSGHWTVDIWQIICCVGWNKNVFGLVQGLFWISLEFRITLNNLSFKVIEELNEFEKGYLPPENHEEKLKVNLMPQKCIHILSKSSWHVQSTSITLSMKISDRSIVTDLGD